MTIEKNLNGTELNVKVSGRLDTTTAPQLELSLKESFEGLEKLVLDFINDKDYVPMKFNDIAAILSVPNDEIYILSRILDTLVYDGEIIKERDGKYKSISKDGLIVENNDTP